MAWAAVMMSVSEGTRKGTYEGRLSLVIQNITCWNRLTVDYWLSRDEHVMIASLLRSLLQSGNIITSVVRPFMTSSSIFSTSLTPTSTLKLDQHALTFSSLNNLQKQFWEINNKIYILRCYFVKLDSSSEIRLPPWVAEHIWSFLHSSDGIGMPLL